MKPYVGITLSHEHAQLVYRGLRELVTRIVDMGDADSSIARDLIGQIEWIAAYIEHKERDAR